MECQPLGTGLVFFDKMDNDLFLKVALDDPENKLPQISIFTLSQLSAVCWLLNDKIKNCWQTYAKYLSAQKLSLLSPFQQFDPDKVQEFFIKQTLIAKRWIPIDSLKWQNMKPIITKSVYYKTFDKINYGQNQIGITTNSYGKLSIWFLDSSKLEKTDLCTLEWDAHLSDYHQIDPECKPGLVFFDKWIAISRLKNDCSSKHIISIVNRSSKKIEHTIPLDKFHNIRQMQSDQTFLYVLCVCHYNEFEMLQYNSNNWDAPPKKLDLKKQNIHKFYINESTILFLIASLGNSYHVMTIQKNECFNNGNFTFLTKGPFLEISQIKAVEEGFLVLKNGSQTLHSPDNSVSESKIIIEKLSIHKGKIQIQKLLELPRNINNIKDFHVQYDKIFLAIRHGVSLENISIECFDLIDKSCTTLSTYSDYMWISSFSCQFVSTVPHRLNLLYLSTRKNFPVASIEMNFGN